MAQYISVFSPVLNPSILMYAPSQPRNPSRRMASSAKEPSSTETLSRPSRVVARGEAESRLRNRTEYFLSATRARMMGMPCAPVPPMTKILEVVWEDTAVASNRCRSGLITSSAAVGRGAHLGEHRQGLLKVCIAQFDRQPKHSNICQPSRHTMTPHRLRATPNRLDLFSSRHRVPPPF